MACSEAETAGPPCLGFPSANSGRSGERQVVPGPAGRRIPAGGGGGAGGAATGTTRAWQQGRRATATGTSSEELKEGGCYLGGR